MNHDWIQEAAKKLEKKFSSGYPPTREAIADELRHLSGTEQSALVITTEQLEGLGWEPSTSSANRQASSKERIGMNHDWIQEAAREIQETYFGFFDTHVKENVAAIISRLSGTEQSEHPYHEACPKCLNTKRLLQKRLSRFETEMDGIRQVLGVSAAKYDTPEKVAACVKVRLLEWLKSSTALSQTSDANKESK